jgi:hypothetical protein
MNIKEVREIIEEFGYPEYVVNAEEILKLAEALTESYVTTEDIQEASNDFHRQCEEDNTIMRDRQRAERKRNSFRIGEDWDEA